MENMRQMPPHPKIIVNCQNPNSTTTQPNITWKLGFTQKLLSTPPPPTAKLYVSNISDVTDPILTKFYIQVPETIFNRCQLSRWHFSRQHLSLRQFQILTKLEKKVLGTIFNRCKLLQWYMSRWHLSWWFLSISRISRLLVFWFWPIFKERFLGPFLTDANC